MQSMMITIALFSLVLSEFLIFCKASGCDMTLTTTTGNFTSPGFPSTFLNGKQCAYIIRVPAGKTIQLNFISFDLGQLGCAYAEVKVYEGSSASGQPVLTKCGTGRDPYISQGNQLYIAFKAVYMTSSGFHIAYAARNGCEMILENSDGAFSSPKHPMNYPEGASCTYRISGPAGTKISLIFSKFNMESSAGCKKDSLKIYEGTDATGAISTIMCGSNRTQFLSQGSNLFLHFSTDASVSDEGFRIFYVAGQLGCDQVLSGSAGNITSPGYPSQYPNNARCVYKINAPTGTIISLHFFHFSLTGYGDMDRLYIYEGVDESGLLTDSRRWAIDYPYLSSSNNLVMVFHTDLTGTSNGFKIQFTALSGCNMKLTAINGKLTSPLYPHSYPNNTLCNYSITVAKGKRIHLYFQKFELENQSSCLSDNLKIYEGSNKESSLAETLCGKYDNKQFISASNELFLQMKTNGMISAAGFIANYYTTSLSCDQTLYSPSGQLKSPNFPNNYPNNAKCTYQIRGKAGQKILLIFSEVSIGQSAGCTSDSLKIYEERISEGSLVSSRCGNDTTSVLSSASKLYAVFKSDMSLASSGFDIFYQIGPEGCGGVFTAAVGSITSPVISGKYPNNAVCNYKITGAAGKRISLIFSAFALQYESSCKFDSLRIYEGASDANGTLIATRCGSDVTTLLSTSNQLFMVFATDSSESMAGFTISYVIGDHGCNKIIRNSTGSISSPFSPSPYPNNAFCTYSIEVPAGHRIELTFQRLMLQSCCTGVECDTLKVYDGVDDKSSLLKAFCGTKSSNVVSSSNKMYIEFRSDGSIPNYGFQATFKAKGQGICMKLQPCYNNGTCIEVTEASYKCNCLPRYTGTNCTVQFLPCALNPCQNGGQCVDRYDLSKAFFECICKDGYTGNECQTKFDECEGYLTEDRWQRSVGNKIKTGSKENFCDSLLVSSWYRFMSKAGTDMPNSCPSKQSCGTYGPIWANGTLPAKTGDYSNMTACVRNEVSCCSTSWNLRVKKCSKNGTNFNVYRLLKPPSCPMAYCAGTEIPCPPGWNSPNGFTPGCTNDFPKILSKPTISPHVMNNKLEFRCEFGSDQKNNLARFEVTWYEGSPLKQINKTDILMGGARISKLNNDDDKEPLFRLGTTVFCRVRSWYASKSYAVSASPSYESNHYFAGIKIVPEKTTYTTTEASKPMKLTVIVTVPIVCKTGSPCKLVIQLDQDNLDVFLGACVIEFNPGPANQTQIIEIVAKRDFVNDGTQRVSIRIKIISHVGLPDWNNHHKIKNIIIIVIDIHTERCTSSGDPHLISFDKLYFNHYKVGDYVLVNSTCRQFEVHVRTWKCAAVTCNCGIAAREGNDVIVVDMCRDGVPRARLASKTQPEEGTSITRDKTGKSYIIRFPSGAYIRMDNYRWYGNVYYANVIVEVPSDDFNCTIGLCGNFDRNMHNDMKSKDGKIHTTMDTGFQAPVGFTESWRLKVGESLFYYKDKSEKCKKPSPKQHCTCQMLSSGKFEAKCGYKSIIDKPTYIISGQGWSKLGSSSFRNCDKRIRRESSSTLILPDYGGEFDYQYDPPQLIYVPVTWPTKAGKTKAEVETRCQKEVKESDAGKICAVIADFPFSSFVQQCVEDVQMTDNYAFAISAIRSMQDACQEIFLKNTTYWVKDAANNGTLAPPTGISKTLCPGLCSCHGKCVNATCRCDTNLTSTDCSINKNKGPTITLLDASGLCDVRKRNDCNIVRMNGYEFIDTGKLLCRSTKIKVSRSGYTLTNQQSVNKAVLISFAEITCHFSKHSIQINGDAKKTTGTPIDGYLIDITNDGSIYSTRRIPYLIYDSKCLECSGATGSCQIRKDTCNINGYCFAAGESAISDKSSKCDPSKSKTSFTKAGNSGEDQKSNLGVIAVIVSVGIILLVAIILIIFVKKQSKIRSMNIAQSIEMTEKHENSAYMNS